MYVKEVKYPENEDVDRHQGRQRFSGSTPGHSPVNTKLFT